METKVKIRIREILELSARMREINSHELNEIDFIDDNGMPIDIDSNLVEHFRFIGLNNMDFINTGFYKSGYDENFK